MPKRTYCTCVICLHLLQTAIAGIVYITGIGCGLITSGITMDRYTDLEVFGDYKKSSKLTFAGSLVATFFWVI